MKWEKERLDEMDEVLDNLNSLKILAKDRLKENKEKLVMLINEMPEYIELYKKMKGE